MFLGVMSTYLCVLGCDKECIFHFGSWSEGLKAADLLKSYQTPDTVLNTLHVVIHLPYSPVRLLLLQPLSYTEKMSHIKVRYLVQSHAYSRRWKLKGDVLPLARI